METVNIHTQEDSNLLPGEKLLGNIGMKLT
jgi:hypothetical protein